MDCKPANGRLYYESSDQERPMIGLMPDQERRAKMPIVVSQQTGKIISKPDYTQDDYDRAWEAVARAWAKKYPDKLCAVSDQAKPVNHPEAVPGGRL